MNFVPASQRNHPAVAIFIRMREAMGVAKLAMAAGTALDRIEELTPLAEAGDTDALFQLAAFEVAQGCQCPPPGALMPRQMSVGRALQRAESALLSGESDGCAPCALALLL